MEIGGDGLWAELRRQEIILMRTANGKFVFVDFKRKRVASLERLGIKMEEFKKAFHTEQMAHTPTLNIQPVARLLQQQGGSSDSNREYEIEQNGYGEVDGEWKLTR